MSTSKLRALDELSACLRGEVPASVDWLAVIALANTSLTVTNLAARVLHSDLAVNVPHDARTFLEEVRSRNESRNRLLRVQIEELVGTLHSAGIPTILLKGAALLVGASPEKRAERMNSDIDVLVNVDQFEMAIQHLQGIGYRIFENSGNAGEPVTMGRDADVGMVDIHTSPRGPKSLVANEQLRATTRVAHLGQVEVRLPSPTFQILHFILHDQFHGRDFWAGNLDLRHLGDLASIMSQSEVDWGFLRSVFAGRYYADVLAYQMIVVNRLFAVPILADFANRPLARLQYWRVRTQIRFPFLRMPLICMTILLGGFRRNRDSMIRDVSLGRRVAGKAFGIGKLFGSVPLGKI